MGTADGQVVEVAESDGKGRRWVRFPSGSTGWLDEASLTPLAAKPWPPVLETKTKTT
jgi:hypothetical protein